MLLRASRALAAVDGRDYVTPDDVKALALPVMAHRILLSADAAMGGKTAASLLAEIIAAAPVPVRDRA